jgi:hypothetical protein
MTKYKNPFSVAQRKPVVISTNDPRNNNLNEFKSKSGTKVLLIKEGKSMDLEDYVENNYWIQTTEYTSSTASRLNTANKNFIWYVENTNDSQHSSTVKITQYSQDGKVIWQKLLTDTKNLLISSIVCDSTNNLYIAGMVGSNSISLTVQYGYLAKINTSGSILWERIINKAATSSTEDQFIQNINAIAIDSNKNIYASLQYNRNITLIKYNTNGSVIWNTDITDPNLNNYGQYNQLVCYSLAVDSTNNCYIVGKWSDLHTINLTYILKIDLSGTIEWQKTSPNFNSTTPSTAKIDQNNKLLIGTSKFFTYPDVWPTLIKIDSDGTLLSNISFPVGSSLYGRSIHQYTIDSKGNIYWINWDQTGGLSAEIYKLDTNYLILWKKDYQTSLQSSRLNSISLISNGFVISNSNSIAYLPIDGTKTGTYFVASLTAVYGNSSYNSNITNSATFTNRSYSKVSTPYFFSNSYSTTATTPTYSPSIVYI